MKLSLVVVGLALGIVGCRSVPPLAKAPRAEVAESKGAVDYFMMLRSYPDSGPDTGTLLAEWELAQARRAFEPEANEWKFVGPKNMATPDPSNYYGTKPIVGRIMAVAVENDDDPAIFLGAANGGMWRGKHRVSWTPYSDRLYVDSMAGALAEGGGKVYLGSGDVHRCYHPAYKSLPTFGVFIYDKAAGTWEHTGRNEFGTLLDDAKKVIRPGAHVGSIALVPESAGTILATAAHGAPKTDDSANPNGVWRLAGGTWTKTSPNNRNYIDLAVGALSQATGRRYIYAVAVDTSKMLRSIDGGVNWVELETPASINGTNGMAVAASPTDPNTVYLMSCDRERIWVNRKAGDPAEWTNITSAAAVGGITVKSFFEFKFYNWALECGSVKDAAGKWQDILIAGGTDLWVLTNAAARTWVTVGNVNAAGGNLHSDQHGLSFAPKNKHILYAGCDGGIYRITFNANLTFSVDNYMRREPDTQFGVTQLYKVAVVGADHGIVLGAAQDNSAPYATGAADGANKDWKNIVALGDGGFADVHLRDDKVMAVSGYYSRDRDDPKKNRFAGFMTKDAWATKKSMANPTGDANPFLNEFGMFFPPMCIDVASTGGGGYAYLGLTRLWFFRFSDGTWNKVSDTRLGSGPGDVIVSVAVAPSSYLYVYTGSRNGEVWLTKFSGGITVEYQRRIDTGTPATGVGLPVTAIAVDPTNPKRILVGYGGNDRGQIKKRLFLCEDTTKATADRVWEDVHKAVLPEIPINAIAFYPEDPAKEWWVTNDLGVYYTQDKGATWKDGTKNLPATMVTDIRFRKGSPKITIATFGRGIWSTARASIVGGGGP